MGPGEVQTLYVKLHRSASGGVPDWGGFDWDTPLDNEARLGNEPSRWGSRLTWFFGLVLIAVTVAFSVVVVGSPAPVERGDGDDTFGAMPMHHLSKDIIRRSDTLAYDVTEIDWLTLRSDLEILVSDCRCGPVSPCPLVQPSPLRPISRCPSHACPSFVSRLHVPIVVRLHVRVV